MNTTRPCGCKAYRTCLLCESDYGLITSNIEPSRSNSFVYCPQCNQAWPGWDWKTTLLDHPNHTGTPLQYPGVYIEENFLTPNEEESLMEGIDSTPWSSSQSGRRKQNYGPKCNFKKRKLKLGDFNGFPKFSNFVQEKFCQVLLLQDFQTIEQCSLEYSPERGASIDPHVDDCWIWGERVVSVNLLSDSVLTMIPNRKKSFYNLDCVKNYPSVLKTDGTLNDLRNCYQLNGICGDDSVVVRIPMPRLSLLVLFNSARYDWEHQILREDIEARRICLAYREFTPNYLKNGSDYQQSECILRQAKNFW